MSEENFFGLDLGEEMTQLSWYSPRHQAPESVSLSGKEQEFLFPTLLCYRAQAQEWLAGEDALRMAARGGELVRGLLGKLRRKEPVLVGEQSILPELLMERYLKSVLELLRLRCGAAKLTCMAVTAPGMDEELRTTLLQIFLTLGIKEEQLIFLNRTECFMYYTIHTKPELWTNDVALFDYDGEHFYYDRLSFARKRKPIAVTAEHMDFTGELEQQRQHGSDEERRAYWFYEMAMKQFHKQYITTVYVTGLGFEGGWAGDALKKLCNGRRVFQGQNLYTKGACYAARMIFLGLRKDYMFLFGDMITESIALCVYKDTRNDYLELAKVGTPYQQVHTKIRVILDATDELEFLVDDILKKESVHEVMILENLMQRENKTICLELELTYVDRDTPVVRVRDIGFIEKQSTARIWEQIL
ncbi:MAG: hypothetical protein IJY09_06090 [Lachnospiraceae bacterium]|nr:hypothetical protein [Lachnospiraceae bacterium]